MTNSQSESSSSLSSRMVWGRTSVPSVRDFVRGLKLKLTLKYEITDRYINLYHIFKDKLIHVNIFANSICFSYVGDLEAGA